MSTGLECMFVERQQGEWYYLLERWESPKGGDWIDYCDCFGPFITFDLAEQHLSDNHANPGGWSQISYSDDESAQRWINSPTLTSLFAKASRPSRRPQGEWYGRYRF